MGKSPDSDYRQNLATNQFSAWDFLQIFYKSIHNLKRLEVETALLQGGLHNYLSISKTLVDNSNIFLICESRHKF